jgi:hypothetical protein
LTKSSKEFDQWMVDYSDLFHSPKSSNDLEFQQFSLLIISKAGSRSRKALICVIERRTVTLAPTVISNSIIRVGSKSDSQTLAKCYHLKCRFVNTHSLQQGPTWAIPTAESAATIKAVAKASYVKTESVSESWGIEGNWSDKLLLVECVI